MKRNNPSPKLHEITFNLICGSSVLLLETEQESVAIHTRLLCMTGPVGSVYKGLAERKENGSTESREWDISISLQSQVSE